MMRTERNSNCYYSANYQNGNDYKAEHSKHIFTEFSGAIHSRSGGLTTAVPHIVLD